MKKLLSTIIGAIIIWSTLAVTATATRAASLPDKVTDNAAKGVTIDPDSAYHLNSVEVLGFRRHNISKINVKMKDLPFTISKISMKPLKVRGIFDFQEAMRYTPSVNVRTTYGAFQQLSVRGFDYSPVEIDGMRDERTTFNSYPLPDLTMVESIETTKGPASILSGHSSVGGAVNIVRKSASNIPTLELMLVGGSWNTYQVTGTVGGQLVKGVNTLFNVNLSGGDGWRDRGDKRFSVYNNTNFQLAPNHILDLRLSYNNDYYGTETGLPATTPGELIEAATGKSIYQKGDMLRGLNMGQRYNTESDFMYHKSGSVLLRYTYYITDAWKLSNRTMYSHDVIDYFSTEELSYPTSDEPIYPYYYMEGDSKKYIDIDHVKRSFPLRFQHVAKTIQNQFDVSGKFDIGSVKNNLLAGFSYTMMDRVSFSGYSVAKEPYAIHHPLDEHDVWGPGVKAITSAYHPDNSLLMHSRFSKASPSKTQVIGLFVQDVIEFSEQIKAFAALRYNNYGIRHYPKSDVTDRVSKYQIGEEKGHLVYNSLTYRLGLVYEPTESLSLYGSFANFFLPDRSSRSYNEKQILMDKHGKVIDQATIDFKKAVFDPTTGYQIELGTNYSFNDRLSGSLALFHIKQKNLVRHIGNVPGVVNGEEVMKRVTAQVGTVISNGLEAEINYNPVRQLFLSLGYGLNDTRYGEIADNELNLKGVNKGDRLNYVPMHTFYTYGNYTIQKGVLRGLDLNYSVTYTDKIYRNYGSDLYYDPYTLVNVGAHYTVKGTPLTIGLQVNNLFDKTYFAQSLGNQLMPAAPRNFKLMINYKIF